MMRAIVVVLFAVLAFGCKGSQVELKTEQDKLSYAYGMEKARTIIDDTKLIGLNRDIVQAAVAESLAGKSQLGAEDALKYMMVVNRQMIEKSEKLYKEQFGELDPFKDDNTQKN